MIVRCNRCIWLIWWLLSLVPDVQQLLPVGLNQSLPLWQPAVQNIWIHGFRVLWSNDLHWQLSCAKKIQEIHSRLLLMRSYCRSIWPGYETLSCTGFSIFLIQMRHWHKHWLPCLQHCSTASRHWLGTNVLRQANVASLLFYSMNGQSRDAVSTTPAKTRNLHKSVQLNPGY